MTCEAYRPADVAGTATDSFARGARAGIWCGSPSASVSQLALFRFVDLGSMADYWSWRLRQIPRTPAGSETACQGGTQGTRSWAFGQIACYVEDGRAKIKWTDERSTTYGLIDTTGGDLEALYSWWLSKAMDLGA